jgi:hypothetical protein
MHLRKLRCFPLVLCTVLAALGGCSGGTSLTPTTNSAEVSANFQALSDIPIPSGTTLDPERSLILGNMDRWTGRVVMRLGIPMSQAVGMFQQQMPAFGWQPVMAMQSETTVLTYLRGERAATVMISPPSIGGAIMGGSIASITVAPRQADGTGASVRAEPRFEAPADLPAPRRR